MTRQRTALCMILRLAVHGRYGADDHFCLPKLRIVHLVLKPLTSLFEEWRNIMRKTTG